jgi:hypothetical protein
LQNRIRTGGRRRLRIERDFNNEIDVAPIQGVSQQLQTAAVAEKREQTISKYAPSSRRRFVTKEQTETKKPFVPKPESDTLPTDGFQSHTFHSTDTTMPVRNGKNSDTLNILDQRKTSISEGVTTFQVARGSLEEALSYALAAGYRLYEVDIRIALARVYLAVGDREIARIEAGYALYLSNYLGYYWGQVDANDVLDAL